ncbi:hypothetical protein CR513_62177, partial [Mucuna pruriens]
MFLLHQCVDISHFEKIYIANIVTEAWDILEKGYTCGEKMKELRQYELMQMEDLEKVSEYFIHILSFTNLMA